MRKIILLLISGILLSACSEEKLPPIEGESFITGLSLPVRLGAESCIIPLSDFCPDTARIDKITLPELSHEQCTVEDYVLTIETTSDMPAVMSLDITMDGITESVPLYRSAKQAVEMVFDPGEKTYEKVSMRGEFSGWATLDPGFQLQDGIWKTTLYLNPGTYQYLLVLDGEDALDPANAEKIDNNMGKFNSLMSVGLDIAANVPVIFTDEYEDDDIEIGYKGNVDGLMVFWQNIRLPKEYIERDDDMEFEIEIPDEASEIKRSFIRVWAWNDYGVSNDILIPLEHGKVVHDAALINRFDMHSMILYNAFVDRFYDADPENNRPLNIPEVLPPADYHGGDIKGVTQKIKDGYFKRLGVNTIWVSPLVKNPETPWGFWPDPPSKFSGYHGYWPISFTVIDDRYGTEEDLHEMVKAAHENDMNVLLDIVANHVHIDHPVYKEHPDWATDLYLPDGTMNTEKWDEHRLTTWFDVHLPTLDLSKPAVYEMLSDSAIYWIRKYDLDGFRHDATKHIPLVFWRTLTKKLKAETAKGNRQYYQIGETYGGADLISSYLGTGMLDAQFDFNVYDDALATLIRESEPFSRLDASVKESMQYYGSHNLMGYITGNQDRGRFISYAGGDLLFDEDAKAAGWTRDIGVGDVSAYNIIKMLFAFNMTIPGLPVIYYGDEIAMPGGNDPDCRRMMRFDDWNESEQDVFKTVQKLTELRKTQLPLLYGDFETLYLSEKQYAYCRTYFDQIAIVVMNKGGTEEKIIFDLPERFHDINFFSHFGSNSLVSDGKFSVELGPRAFDIYTKGFQPY